MAAVSVDKGVSSAVVNGADSTLTGTSGDTTTTQTSTQGVSTIKQNVAAINEPDGSVTTVTSTTSSGNTGPDTTAIKSTTSTQSVGSDQTNTSSKNATGTTTTGADTLVRADTVDQTALTGNTSTTYTDPNQIHRTTPILGVSMTKGSDQITVASATDLRVGMTMAGPGIASGSTIIGIVGTNVQLSKPAITTASGVSLSADSSSVIFLTMSVDGYRESTDVVALTPLAAPSAASGYQIGMSQTLPPGVAAPAATGGTTGGAAAGGGTGA